MGKNKYKIVSLFSGCGGLDLGFRGNFSSLGNQYKQLNFDLIWANDVDKNACLTFSKNFQKTIVCADIRDILNGIYPSNNCPLIPARADIVLGGFPCQDFSISGKRQGLKTPRGLLYQSMINVVSQIQPMIFIAENVKGLLTLDKGNIIKKITQEFSKIGYDVVYKLLHVADYGVPENRERIIIVGTNKKLNLPVFEYPKPLLTKDNWLNLRYAIGDLADQEEGSIHNHYWSKAKMFPGTQGNSIVNPDKIGPTMRAEHHGNIEWHWNQKRRLSAREAARIQSFPDDFIFYPSTSSAYRQIGNAVPPAFAWHIAKTVQDYLDKYI